MPLMPKTKISPGDLHAVFAVTKTGNVRLRVTDWTDWGTAGDTYIAAKDPFQPGGTPKTVNGEEVFYLAVRAGNDPGWNNAPEALLEDEEGNEVCKPKSLLPYVKLTRGERQMFADQARAACHGLDDAACYLADAIDATGRFGHLEYIVISDYAWALARFIYPQEAKYS